MNIEIVNESMTVNESELEGTRTVRRLAKVMAEQGMDLALIGVARGEYPGVTFKLASRDDYFRRMSAARDAFTRQRAV